MSSSNVTRRGLGACVLLAAIAAAMPARAADPVRIGINIPLTGVFADSIRPVMFADQLWEKQINERGGLLGRKVEITFIDNKSNVDTGVSVAQRLLQGDYEFVFEDGGSALVQRESTLSEQYKKLMLAPAGFAKALYARGYKYLFFTGNALSDDVSLGLIRLIETMPADQRPKTIGYATVDNIAFTAATRGAQERSKALNLVSVVDVSYPPNLNDAAPIVENLKQKNPDVVFQQGLSNDTILFTRAAKQQGLRPEILAIGYTAGALPNFVETVGDAAELVVYCSNWEPDLKNASNEAFVGAYQKMHGVAPTYNSAHGYARWQILEQAVNATKSFDQTLLRDYIASHEFETVVGPIKYNAVGYSEPKDTVLVQFQKGKRVIVWPKEQATGKLIFMRSGKTVP
jgi:branched-chain amino acid transport system substrate-binding protein